MSFEDDLKFGNDFERLWIETIKNNNYDEIYQVPSNISFYDYDIKTTKDGISTTYEVKADRVGFLGSIAVEFMFKNQFSGINKTKADYWIHFSLDGLGGYRIYKFHRKELKKLIKDGLYKDVKTSKNGAQVVIIDFDKITKYIYKVVYGDFLDL